MGFGYKRDYSAVLKQQLGSENSKTNRAINIHTCKSIHLYIYTCE